MIFNRETLTEIAAQWAAVIAFLAILNAPLAVGYLVASHFAKHQKAVDPKTEAYMRAWDATHGDPL